MAAPSLWVNLGLRSAAFDRGLNRSRGKLKGFSRDSVQLSHVMKGVLRSTLALAGVGGMGYLAASFVRTASMAEETGAKFDMVFKDLSGSTRKWAVEFGDDVGRATHHVEGWLAGLQDTFVPLGIARDESAELSKSLVKLAVDVASFNNKADADVIRDFTSALVGNHETVRKYGIIISESAIKQEALASGLNKTYSQLTDLEKVQMRYSLIQQGTTDAQGDAIRTASSFANQVKRLKANWEEFSASAGKPAIIVLADLLDSLNKIIDRLPSFENAMVRMLKATGAPKEDLMRHLGALQDMGLAADEGVMEKFVMPGTAANRDNVVAESKGMGPLSRPTSIPSAAKRRMSAEAYGAHVAREQWEREGGKIVEEVDKTTDEIAERWQRVGWTMGASMSQAADAMIWEHQKAADAINNILRNLANDMMYQWIFAPLGNAMGSGLRTMFKTAGGPVGEKAAADGMVATSPTRMLFGEAGPEAAMPLVRGPGGKLGVANYGGSGGGGTTIQIINNSSQPVTARVGDVRQDIRGTITQVFLEDQRDGGPISQSLRSERSRG